MLLRLHIWVRSLFYRKKAVSVRRKLREAVDIPFVNDTKIIFLWVLSGVSRRPNAMSVCPGIIAVNAEWATRLVLFDEPDVKDSFRYTIGHEMTHQSGDYKFWEAFTRDKRFVNWVGEIHADYGGAIFAFEGNLQKTISALEYKAKDHKHDKDHQTHPSWKHRKEYLSLGRFDPELVKLVAKDVGCNNKNLIEKVSKFYSPIELEVTQGNSNVE